MFVFIFVTVPQNLNDYPIITGRDRNYLYQVWKISCPSDILESQSLYGKGVYSSIMSIHAATIMIMSTAGKKKTSPKKGNTKPTDKKQK